MNSTKTFVPFQQSKDIQDLIVVDAVANRGLVLSHWRGANTHQAIWHDTSAGIVLHALAQNTPGTEYPHVTASHFDVDGFLGVWSLFYPELALQYQTLLAKAARLGDFREWNPFDPEDHHALQLVCWIDTMEKQLFYEPFGATDDLEIRMCVQKFEWFIPRFADVLVHTHNYKAEWEAKYNAVIQDWQALQQSGRYTFYPDIKLAVIHAPYPMQYYALFAPTYAYDAVLTLYPNHRYELEYKYTTWIDVVSCTTYPRLDLRPLAAQLQQLEKSPHHWYADKITDTGPILRLHHSDLSKKERFASPKERHIASSSIPPEQMEQIVVSYFNIHLQNITPKNFWTWKEIHAINEAIHNTVSA